MKEQDLEKKHLQQDSDQVIPIGQRSQARSKLPCGIDSSCMVQVTGNLHYCNHKDSDCPVIKAQVYKKLERCGIYRRFQDCTFKTIEHAGVPESVREQYSQVKKYAASLKKNIDEGRGLLLKGAVGTMKTTLAVSVLQEQIAQGGSGLFITMSSLLDNIFTLKAKSVKEWVNFETKLREISLLVLDDMGSEYTEGWVLTKLDAIISERYNRCRSIIITTNLSAEQLKTTYAERIIDRLKHTLTVVNFNGNSLRRPA